MTAEDGVSLKEYVDTEFCAVREQLAGLEKLQNVMVENIEEATTLARVGIERRLETISEKIEGLSYSEATLKGKASQRSVTWSYVFSGAALFVAIATIVVAIVLK